MDVESMYDAKEVTELAAKPRVERERALWSASEKYMRGEITLRDYKTIERPYVCLEYAKTVGAPYGRLEKGRFQIFLDALVGLFR